MPKRQKNSGGIGVIYARYSSHAQKDCSIEQQVEAARKYAKEKNIEIINVYADRAVSGRTDKRPEFQKLMRDAEAGKFKYVVAWKSNRMGRNMLQAMANEDNLKSWGIRCEYVEENFDDTAAGRFALRSMMNVNQFYSENMAEDIRRGLIDNAKNGFVNGGVIPFGYRKGEDGKYAIDPEKGAIVEEIFRRVATGEMFADIFRDLNRRGIKTARGREWNKHSFQILLHNERYKGIYIYGEVRVEGGMPRLISDEMFAKVQEVTMTKKKPQGKRSSDMNAWYLLSGKLFCGKCGSPMTGAAGTSKTGTVYNYYACNKKRYEHTCDKKNVPRDEIEQLVADTIRERVLVPEIVDKIADMAVEYNKKCAEESDLYILNEQRTQVGISIDNIIKAIEKGIITDSTKARLEALEAERRDLESKIALARADIIEMTKDEIVAGLMMFKDGDFQDRKFLATLFDTFIKAVYVYDNEIKIVFSYTKANNVMNISLKDIEEPPEDDDEPKSSRRVPYGALLTRFANSPIRLLSGGMFVIRAGLNNSV